jgi:hypothetical protein
LRETAGNVATRSTVRLYRGDAQKARPIVCGSPLLDRAEGKKKGLKTDHRGARDVKDTIAYGWNS